MADREMPNLKARLTLDTSDVTKAKAQVAQLQQSTAQGTQTVSASRAKADQLLAELAAERVRVGAVLDESATSAAAGIDSAAVSAEAAAGAVSDLDEGVVGAAGGLVQLAGVAQSAGQAINALRAGQSAAAGATSGLAQSVGTGNLAMAGLAIGATALSVGMQLFASGGEDAREQQEALNKALDDGIGKLDLTRDALAEFLLTSEDAFFTAEQLTQLREAGVTIDDLHASVLQGTASLGGYAAQLESVGKVVDVTAKLDELTESDQRNLIATNDLVEVNGRYFDGNTDLIESQRELLAASQETAEKAIEVARVNALVTDAQFEAAVSANTAADGTINYVAAQQQLQVSATFAARANDILTDALRRGVEAGREALVAQREAAQSRLDDINASFGAATRQRDGERQLAEALGAVDNALGRGTQSRAAATKASESAEAAARREAQAERQVQNARDAVADASDRLTESETKVAEARAELDKVSNVTVAKERAEALRDIADANDRIVDAQEKVIDAQKRLDEALAGPSQRDVQKADLQRRESLDQLEAAENAVADATRLRDRSLLSANPRRRAAAEEELTDAMNALESAQIRAAESTERHDELAGFSAATSDEVAEARRGVERAERDVAKAQEDAVATQQKLIDQLGPNLDGSVLLEEARRKLAKAEEEVRDRTDDVAGRSRDLADAQEQRLTPTTSAAVQPMKDLAAALDGAEQQMVAMALNAPELAAQLQGVSVASFNAGEKARIQRDKLLELQGTLGPDDPLRARLQGYIDQLGLVPGAREATLVLKTEDAQRAFDEFYARMQEQLDQGFDPNQRANDPNFTGNRQSRAHGGSVTAGVDYIVNDGVGPEVFRPNVSGRMELLNGLTPIGGGGGVTVGDVNVSFTVGEDVSEFTMMRLRREIPALVESGIREALRP